MYLCIYVFIHLFIQITNINNDVLHMYIYVCVYTWCVYTLR